MAVSSYSGALSVQLLTVWIFFKQPVQREEIHKLPNEWTENYCL